jgi:hypothetical protein
MKVSQTVAIIDQYIALGAVSSASELGSVLKFLEKFREFEMKEFHKRASLFLTADRWVEKPHRSPVLAPLSSLLLVAKAHKDVIKDVEYLADLLRHVPDSGVLDEHLSRLGAAMQPKTTEQLIAEFTLRLNREIGTPAFERTFAELANSPLKGDDIVTVAVDVYGWIKKGTSRKKALDYIRMPHDAFSGARRVLEAQGGRSAA